MDNTFKFFVYILPIVFRRGVVMVVVTLSYFHSLRLRFYYNTVCTDRHNKSIISIFRRIRINRIKYFSTLPSSIFYKMLWVCVRCHSNVANEI